MSQGWSAQGEVSQALRALIAEFGSQVLGNPALLANLLKDHVPDHPREINVLQAAAQSGAAAAVDDRIRSGMAPAAAVRMTAGELSNSLAIDATAAEWGVGEFAQALGYTLESGSAAQPQADVTQLPAAQPRDQQPGATIASPAPAYADQQPPGNAPAQAPAARSRARRRLMTTVIAVAVVVAGVGAFFVIRPGPKTGAQCVVGDWVLQSGRQKVSGGGFSGYWYVTSGNEEFTYASDGSGTITDTALTMSSRPSATHPGRLVQTDSGTFGYHVVGREIKYHDTLVPGSETWLNLTTGKKHTYTYKSVYNNAPDQFSCSGNTLQRSGPGYSYTYTRQ